MQILIYKIFLKANFYFYFRLPKTCFNLQMGITFTFHFSNDKTFVVGVYRTLTVRVSVHNAAGSDPAYNAKLELTLSVPIIYRPPLCEEIGNLLSCTVGNPLIANSMVNTGIRH
jgi:hypothetical protein